MRHAARFGGRHPAYVEAFSEWPQPGERRARPGRVSDRMLGILEHKGFIFRKTCVSDKRDSLVCVTPAGRKKMALRQPG